MFNFKLVLLAAFLLIGCVFALSQGEANERSATYENDLASWAERESRQATERAMTQQKRASPCSPRPAPPANQATSAPKPPSAATSAPVATSAPTTKPTTAPTAAPTSAPVATSAPTTKATPAPTPRPTTPPPSASTSRPVGLCDIVPTSQEPVKILVPLYVYPGAAWDDVIAASTKSGVIAIVNPNSGPLPSGPDSAYKTYMQKLVNAGVEQVGYVYTSWGARNIQAVKADIDIYFNKYPGIKGIFFDEASSDAKDVPFYKEAYEYVIQKGWKHSILNPGVTPAQGYLDISSNIVIFENYGTEVSKTNYASYVKCAPNQAAKAGWKYKFSGIAHTVEAASQAAIISTLANQGMGLIYVTDEPGGCCTYNKLTSYLGAQATAVKAL